MSSITTTPRWTSPDIGLLDQSGTPAATGFTRHLIAGWRRIDEERETSQRTEDRLAPASAHPYAHDLHAE